MSQLKRVWADHPSVVRRVDAIAENVQVRARNLSLHVLEYERGMNFGQRNDAWIKVALQVGEEAIERALDHAGFAPKDVSALFFTTVTGLATPSIDARLVHRMGFSDRVKRTPLFGLGCVAGAAGVARVADYLAGHPDEVALLLSVELCSLTFLLDEITMTNLIAAALFGDGGTATVMTGERRGERGPQVVASRSVLYPASERVMGWDVSEKGFHLVLSPEVPDVVRQYVRRDVDAFLGDHGLTRGEIARFILHPGGPAILEAAAEALEVDDAALEPTWRTLREHGNLSSSSVILVLKEVLADPPPPGSHGLMLAMGPGFCSELVLLRW
jgi:alkylresorcinol/alkylpyrone synthase